MKERLGYRKCKRHEKTRKYVIDQSSERDARSSKRQKLATDKARSKNYSSMKHRHRNTNDNNGRNIQIDTQKHGGYQQQGVF